MNHGFIRTFGKKAITIEDDDKRQYYAPIEEVGPLVKEHLVEPLLYIPVKFYPDKSRSAGSTIISERYYALNVTLNLEF